MWLVVLRGDESLTLWRSRVYIVLWMFVRSVNKV